MAEPSEKELLGRLTALTKDKTAWPQSINIVSSLLSHPSVKVKAKALWLLGEMGLRHTADVATFVPQIAVFLKDANALLRERALNALGRIGRGDHSLAQPHLPQIRLLAADAEPTVRLAFIWACENIAVNTPTLFAKDLPLFASLFGDKNERVRIEAREIFRVQGGRIPYDVLSYRPKLLALSENDENQVVRIHAAGEHGIEQGKSVSLRFPFRRGGAGGRGNNDSANLARNAGAGLCADDGAERSAGVRTWT